MHIGDWLSVQREIEGFTRTNIATAMHWPGRAIKDIEEGRRIPKATTVQKYLETVQFLAIDRDVARERMFERLHAA